MEIQLKTDPGSVAACPWIFAGLSGQLGLFGLPFNKLLAPLNLVYTCSGVGSPSRRFSCIGTV